jgi:anti-sigma regulatory factor (Ser/Thr protein kinase)
MRATATFSVAAAPGGVATARRAVTEAAEGHVGREMVDTTRLLVSELVTNGILHGGTAEPVRVSLRFDDSGLRVEVADCGPGFVPKPRAIGSEELNGFGLFLVERLADRWGVERNDRTHVWFELGNERSP